MFQIVGKYWAEGAIPYKDIWDMKGPFIFLVNAAGYGLTGSNRGVYLIQVLSLFLTLLAVYRTFALRFPAGRSLLLALLSLAGLAYIYEGGNLTEEYLLFPLSLSFYFISRWIDSYEERHVVCHPPLQAAVYGIVFGLSMMSRLTNALGISGAVGVIALTLLWHRKYKNLLTCAAMFLLGAALAAVPFLLYFYRHDALQDMWNGTFLFAWKYASTAHMNLQKTGFHYFALSYLNSALLIAVSLYRMLWRRLSGTRTWLYLLSAGLPFLWFCLGNGYGHYGMTVYPLFVWVMTELVSSKRRLLPSGLALLLVVGALSKVRFMYVICNTGKTDVAEYRRILYDDPSVNPHSFVAYNCDPNLYLEFDIRPAVPVFALQEVGKDRIPEWEDHLVALFQAKKPEWILVRRDSPTGTLMIQPLLSGNYRMARRNADLQLELYRRSGRSLR